MTFGQAFVVALGEILGWSIGMAIVMVVGHKLGYRITNKRPDR